MISIQVLAFAILEVVSLPNGHPVAAFRNHHLGPIGRSEQLAANYRDAARATGMEVFTLIALGKSESGDFDGRKVGGVGELGIHQLHPRHPMGRLYRKLSRPLDQDARDRLSIFLGADALRHGFKVCGTRARALAFYKSGRCTPAGPAVRNVIAIRARLMRAAGV